MLNKLIIPLILLLIMVVRIFVETGFDYAIFHQAIECVSKCVNSKKLSQQSRRVRPKTSQNLF